MKLLNFIKYSYVENFLGKYIPISPYIDTPKVLTGHVYNTIFRKLTSKIEPYWAIIGIVDKIYYLRRDTPILNIEYFEEYESLYFWLTWLSAGYSRIHYGLYYYKYLYWRLFLFNILENFYIVLFPNVLFTLYF